ncbi:MAG: hypothetical protein H6737_31175 [Alphaproteobacteria bacterium]|nr:hypothetical protein [Alphaproteobacteria bacterium]
MRTTLTLALLVGCQPWTEERLMEYAAEQECDHLWRCDDGSGWVSLGSKRDCIDDRRRDFEESVVESAENSGCTLDFVPSAAPACAEELRRYWDHACDTDPELDVYACADVWSMICS